MKNQKLISRNAIRKFKPGGDTRSLLEEFPIERGINGEYYIVHTPENNHATFSDIISKVSEIPDILLGNDYESRIQTRMKRDGLTRALAELIEGSKLTGVAPIAGRSGGYRNVPVKLNTRAFLASRRPYSGVSTKSNKTNYETVNPINEVQKAAIRWKKLDEQWLGLKRLLPTKVKTTTSRGTLNDQLEEGTLDVGIIGNLKGKFDLLRKRLTRVKSSKTNNSETARVDNTRVDNSSKLEQDFDREVISPRVLKRLEKLIAKKAKRSEKVSTVEKLSGLETKVNAIDIGKMSRAYNRNLKLKKGLGIFGVPAAILGVVSRDNPDYNNNNTKTNSSINKNTKGLPNPEDWTLYNKYIDPITKKLKKPFEQHTDEELMDLILLGLLPLNYITLKNRQKQERLQRQQRNSSDITTTLEQKEKVQTTSTNPISELNIDDLREEIKIYFRNGNPIETVKSESDIDKWDDDTVMRVFLQIEHIYNDPELSQKISYAPPKETKKESSTSPFAATPTSVDLNRADVRAIMSHYGLDTTPSLRKAFRKYLGGDRNQDISFIDLNSNLHRDWIAPFVVFKKIGGKLMSKNPIQRFKNI